MYLFISSLIVFSLMLLLSPLRALKKSWRSQENWAKDQKRQRGRRLQENKLLNKQQRKTDFNVLLLFVYMKTLSMFTEVHFSTVRFWEMWLFACTASLCTDWTRSVRFNGVSPVWAEPPSLVATINTANALHDLALMEVCSVVCHLGLDFTCSSLMF